MSKKALFYLGFFIFLLLAFYFVMMATTDFGKVKLPVLNTVHPFSFSRQDGKTISEKDVAGKVYIAEYFFTTCKGICPKMNKNMKAVYEELRSEPGFLILSHTVDPETDSIARLRQYADSMGARVDNWWFLTGSKENLYKSARESYLLDDPKNSSKNIADQFIHTQFFALVDKKGQVRGIYDGLKQDEIKQLIMDTRKTLAE
ncbi:MAG: SCO family protein [Chitinophagaceae bacterium]|jgi:protein SCO1/2|nr:SCO family protein [Chitinophagaceae bacterium]